jgi:aconitase B
MNEDKVPPGKYSVSTSNRNFEGRQGPGSRTILASRSLLPLLQLQAELPIRQNLFQTFKTFKNARSAVYHT